MMLIYILLSLAVIGIFATLGFFAYFFTSIGKNVAPLTANTDIPPPQSKSMIRSLGTISGSSAGVLDLDNVTIIKTGKQFKERLIADIEKAEKYVSLTTFVWDDDEETRELHEALVRAAARGIEARILVDAYGALSFSRQSKRDLESKGIEIGTFRPFQQGKLSIYHERTHRRSCYIDDNIAYMGGMAFTKKWLKKPKTGSETYTDLMYRFEGPVTACIRSDFNELWASVKFEITIAQTQEETADNNATVAYVHLSHSPLIDVHPLTYFLWLVCASARESIQICTPYFVPGKALTDIILKRARDGVAVTIYTQGKIEMFHTYHATRGQYNRMLEAGVTIHEYMPHFLHTKLIVVDTCLTVIGSANIDLRSQRINQENVMAVQDKGFALTHEKILEKYRNDSVTITLREWKKRPLWNRLVERILGTLSEQF